MTRSQLHQGEPASTPAFDHEKAAVSTRLLLEAMGVESDAAPLTETCARRVLDAVDRAADHS